MQRVAQPGTALFGQGVAQLGTVLGNRVLALCNARRTLTGCTASRRLTRRTRAWVGCRRPVWSPGRTAGTPAAAGSLSESGTRSAAVGRPSAAAPDTAPWARSGELARTAPVGGNQQ